MEEPRGDFLLWPVRQPDSNDLRIGVLEWTRHGDRFAHRLGSRSRQTEVAWWVESLEQERPTDWPPSPPVQQIARQTVGPTYVALALGMAGRTHWSVSLEPTASGLRLDVAARVQGVPAFLGSSYRLCGTVSRSAGDRLVVTAPHTGVALEMRPDERSLLELEESADGLAIARLVPCSLEPTTRWGGEFRICGQHGHPPTSLLDL